MEITIKRYSRKLTYEDAATLDEFWELAKRTERSLDREQRRHWDGRECDEYIIAAQGDCDTSIRFLIYQIDILYSVQFQIATGYKELSPNFHLAERRYSVSGNYFG
ncbi:hypothetical protein AALB53_05870 [Lachnospiraceae bacterium 47-T17]